MDLARSALYFSKSCSGDAKITGLLVARRNSAVAGDLNAKHQFVTIANSNYLVGQFQSFLHETFRNFGPKNSHLFLLNGERYSVKRYDFQGLL